MQRPQLETKRLLIRGTRESDAPACLDIWLDEEMGRYMSDPPRDQADEAELNFAVGIEEDDSWHPMVAFLKETGDFAGTCSIVPMEDGKRWDLGYAIHKKYWRQGYATEILQALLTLGKEQGVRSFTAVVAKENKASNALLVKLGFQVCKNSGSFRKRGTDIVYPSFTYIYKMP